MQIALLHPTLTILLLPVLIWQGRKVRKEVPRLPEASGPRQGSSRSKEKATNQPTTPPLRILILGDSAAAGVGVDAQGDALAGQLVSHLPDDLAIEWQLEASNGDKLDDLIERVKRLEGEFDIALISAGVNDVTGRTKRHQFLCQLQTLSYQLQRRLKVQRAFYTAVPPMHVFPALPQPLRWYLGQQAKGLNSVMRAHCQQDNIAHMMVVDFPFTPDYMASDGFHPSAQGYRLWGGRAAALIKEWQANDRV
ncbi:lipase [Aliidiomarina sedimenti]|uniref:Lipase n=1 Tax=Aliidiomarina sedimenti TaxID=1933879 RepID=A0ABY0C2J6_9GAMM|nr:SGNH/GDSL hydrolase family protein [Aliidiomarina sedimenti]RUO32017.1 lipase [Aliidiomarina sedimenti]